MNSAQRSIRLSGVDLVDGTPVLDVKPYVPDYDCPRARDTRGSDGTGREGGVRVAVSFKCPGRPCGGGGGWAVDAPYSPIRGIGENREEISWLVLKPRRAPDTLMLEITNV